MVLRLFVPPGEGQHKLVPKRPDPIGANAALQYSVISSTVLAAAYTSFASRYGQRVAPSQSLSRTALFIRSSARLGLWAGVVGAAVNWYYYSAFASVVVSQKNPKVKPWKLYKWTKRYTVEDGCLAGAALGLAASISTLFMRRPAIPRWTRCLGMANIGSCAGLLGAHGYFQYTGERQKAYKRLDRRLKRRSLEFWAIFWEKSLMAQFDPIIQQYVRHNGIWYTHHLPDSVYEQPDDYGRRSIKSKKLAPYAAAPADSEVQPEEPAYYTQPFDYADDLKQIDATATLAKIEELEAEKVALLKEAEYLLFINAQKEHEYCHLREMDDDERQRRLQEIHLVEIAYNRLRVSAHSIDVKLEKWRMSLQHKAVWEASASGDDQLVDWLPRSERIDFYSHSPTLSIQEMEKFQTQIAGEVKRFEELVADHGYPKEKRDRWMKDLEDGRILLRAADHVVFELEKLRKTVGGAANAVQREDKAGLDNKVEVDAKNGTMTEGEKVEVREGEPSLEAVSDEKRHEKTQVDKEKAAKPPDGSLEPDKP
ncbi:Nn.00g089670.m01.CDS01 [Neocucurbitaria sp. VM-36]